MATPEASRSISAQMSLWRVFGMLDRFDDQPRPYWATTAPGSRPDTDRLTVMIGEIPTELLVALKQWRAQARGTLSIMTGHSMTQDERLAMYREDLETVQLPEFDNPYTAWLTFRLDRSVEVISANDGELDWMADGGLLVKAMQSFAEEGGRFLDCAVARVLGAAEDLMSATLGLPTSDRIFSRRVRLRLASQKRK